MGGCIFLGGRRWRADEEGWGCWLSDGGAGPGCRCVADDGRGCYVRCGHVHGFTNRDWLMILSASVPPSSYLLIVLINSIRDVFLLSS